MVCLVEEEVSVTPYFLHCPSERASHTCFLVGREKSKQAQGPGRFFIGWGGGGGAKNSTCASLGLSFLQFGASRRRLIFSLLFSLISLSKKKVCMGSAESAAIVSLKFFPHFMFAATANGKGRCESFCHHWPWQRTLQPAFQSMNSPFQSMKP